MNALYTITQCYYLKPYPPLPSWASGITTFSLTYYYPHGLQVLPPSALLTTTPLGLRYYHPQSYNPTELLFIPTFYICEVCYLFNCGTMYFCRVSHDHFIYG